MDPFVPHGKVNTAWAPALGHNQSWFWQSPALFLLRPTSNFQKMPGNNKGMTWAKGSSAEAVWARLCDGRGRKATCMDVKHQGHLVSGQRYIILSARFITAFRLINYSLHT